MGRRICPPHQCRTALNVKALWFRGNCGKYTLIHAVLTGSVVVLEAPGGCAGGAGGHEQGAGHMVPSKWGFCLAELLLALGRRAAVVLPSLGCTLAVLGKGFQHSVCPAFGFMLVLCLCRSARDAVLL